MILLPVLFPFHHSPNSVSSSFGLFSLTLLAQEAIVIQNSGQISSILFLHEFVRRKVKTGKRVRRGVNDCKDPESTAVKAVSRIVSKPFFDVQTSVFAGSKREGSCSAFAIAETTNAANEYLSELLGSTGHAVHSGSDPNGSSFDDT